MIELCLVKELENRTRSDYRSLRVFYLYVFHMAAIIARWRYLAVSFRTRTVYNQIAPINSVIIMDNVLMACNKGHNGRYTDKYSVGAIQAVEEDKGNTHRAELFLLL